MLADMQMEIEAAHALLYQAAWLKDSNPTRLGTAASRAKLYASEMANRVAAKAVQIHGSVGYSRETDVERMYRDARVLTIYEGTSEIQRMIIARDLLQRSSAAEQSFMDWERYNELVELRNAGQIEEASAELAKLADAEPDPYIRAVVLMAVATGLSWQNRFADARQTLHGAARMVGRESHIVSAVATEHRSGRH